MKGVHRAGLCLLVGSWLAAAALLACSNDATSDPAPLGTGTARDAGTTDLVLEASVADAAPGELAFHGTLAATATVSFGGNYADASYCKYTVTLKNVTIDLLVQGDQLVASTVKDQMVEAIVGTCSSPSIATNTQTFALATAATATGGGFHSTYLGASGNQPRESLVVDLTRNGTGYIASATWHRIDLFPPFDWTVTATIPIAPQ